MSRLCHEDATTLAKYKQGILHTDLSLQTAFGTESFRVHTCELVKYSDTLANLGRQAVEDAAAANSNAVLRFDGISTYI